ncbi:oligosaccharide repeat unit polymerase [Noviherbaspirillum sedimenti]|uniref:Oligosaccharide repeat unit polymerase n=1 Tax=Noviherbaspirillum sedimenti TaxID=2320865 RepID=A0A3A3G8P3_9BURK|nr:oligosaccharide repeat unit polymerase [Noviherbaspirillum sedimenti]RJG02932.1 hypothetical protein D3878_16205 [Noviherbaspirillum sedimenti]
MTLYRACWLAVYIAANLIAAIVFFRSGQLDGDLIGYPLPDHSVLVVASIAVVASYLIWMGPLFGAMNSFKVNSLVPSWGKIHLPHDEKFVGVFVILVQLLFLLFNIAEGTNVAGSRFSTDSPLRFIWILFVPDTLFLIYYGIYRKSRFFKFNLALYLISNVMRGWLGTWMIVFFMEGAYRVSEKRLDWKKVLLFLVAFSLLLPLLVQIKWTIRTVATGGVFNGNEILEQILMFTNTANWFDSFREAIQPIVMRLQHLANVIAIIDQSSILSDGLKNREFLYFFEEGVPQYTIGQILGMTGVSDIHIMLLTYLIPEQLPVDTITNTHVGLAGWFWIAPHLISIYIFYLLVLCWAGIWLAKKIGGGNLLMSVVWFAWLGFLMNGWFAAYIGFLQGIFILMCCRLTAMKFIPECIPESPIKHA